jgi:hypothetical protein
MTPQELEEEVSRLYGVITWTAETLHELKMDLLHDGDQRRAFVLDTIIMKLVEQLPLE